MSVKLCKLVTGEDVIANVKDPNETSDEGRVELEKPARIVITNQGVGMMPLAPFAKSEKVTINKQHILWQADLELEILNAYNQQFGSNIVIPTGDVRDLASNLRLVSD